MTSQSDNIDERIARMTEQQREMHAQTMAELSELKAISQQQAETARQQADSIRSLSSAFSEQARAYREFSRSLPDVVENEPNRIEVYTLAQLSEEDERERRERLQNGLNDGNFRVYFQRSDLTIQIEENGRNSYEINLEECKNSDELLDWIFQINGHYRGGLLAAILVILDDACEDVHGQNARSLFTPGNTIDWRNPQPPTR